MSRRWVPAVAGQAALFPSGDASLWEAFERPNGSRTWRRVRIIEQEPVKPETRMFETAAREYKAIAEMGTTPRKGGIVDTLA